MRGCPRHFCERCDEEMIHRDHRRSYESASAFGQIIHRDFPRHFTCGDIDLYVERLSGSTVLLRLIEHKQPDHKFEGPQRRVLRELDTIIAHAVSCPTAREEIELHEESGVYLIRGSVEADRVGRRMTKFRGPQIAENARLGTFEIRSSAEMYRWLTGDRG